MFLLVVLRIAGLVRQVEEQAAQLAALARRDGLTGMPNRRAWEGELPSHAPWLVELPGVGPITGAQILVSWSYAGRLRSAAAFAALAGTNPIPASSGQVTRHRLNRSGDRQLNAALHTIALTRLRYDPQTRAYAARRTTQGKTRRDVKRRLKRSIARQLFKLLERYDQPGVEILRAA